MRKIYTTVNVNQDIDITLDIDNLIDDLDKESIDYIIEKSGFYNKKTADSFYRTICDMVGFGYHTSKRELIEEIKRKI